jgi:hypothetical protein
MLRAYLPADAGVSSSTTELFNRVTEVLGTSSGLETVLNNLFGSPRVAYDAQSGCFVIPNGRAPGVTLVVGRGGPTLTVRSAS